MIADGLQTATKVYITALGCIAVGLTLAANVWAAQETRTEPLLAVVFAGCMMLAWLFPLHFTDKTKLYVDTAVVAAAILIFEPAVAMLIAGTGTLLAHGLRRSGRDWTQAIFNAAQAMILAATGGLLLATAGWDPARPSFGEPWPLLLLPVAAVAMHGLSVVAVATVVAFEAREPIVASWREAFVADPRIELLSQVSLFGIGVLAAIVVDAEPWALALLVAPVVAVYGMLRQQNLLRQEAVHARLASEANLATTQRVAHLGSWAWGVTTGKQTWSEEASRIFGLAAESLSPTYETFLEIIDPDDRAAVDRAMRETLAAATPLRIDYRIRQSNGTVRLVHLEADARTDDAGRVVWLAGTVQDLTEQRALEAQVADFSERQRIAAELAKARRRLAESREAERLSLARALHDGPVQDLLAVSYQLAALQPAIGGGRAEETPSTVLNSARHELLDVVGQLRGMIGELRPAGLDEFGLSTALEGYVAGLQRRETEGLPAIFLDVGAGAEELPPPLALSVFQITQEALRNALRHAGAGEVTVGIEKSNGRVELEVHDDGCGFAVPARLHTFAEAGHFGLVGIAERVEQAGGELTVASAPGAGTTIGVRLPLAGARERDD